MLKCVDVDLSSEEFVLSVKRVREFFDMVEEADEGEEGCDDV